MINTIFYFADTVQDYQREKNGQGISDKTITFVKETGDIYLNGVNYGRHSVEELIDSPEIQEALGNIDIEARAGNEINVPDYPTVTTTRSGNKTILTFNHLKGENGHSPVIEIRNVNGEDRWFIDNINTGVNAKGIDGHSPRVEIRQINGKPYWFVDNVNTGVSAKGDDGHSPLVEIREVNGEYYWFIDGVNTGVKASGSSSPSNPGDESWRDAISDLEESVQEAQSTANQAKQDAIDKANAAREAALSAINDSELRLLALIALLTDIDDWGNEQYTAIYNQIQDDVAADILNALKDSNGRTIWNRIDNTDNLISSVITRLNNIVDTNGNVTEALLTIINNYVTDNEAIASLSTKWALVKDNEDILKWMASGITSQTMEGKTFMQFISSAGNNNPSNPGDDHTYVDGAIAGLRTEITNTLNGYVAESSLTAKVLSSLGVESSAQIALKSDVESSATTITNSLGGRISGVESSVSKLQAMVGLVASYNDDTSAASISLTADNAEALVNQIAKYDRAKAVIRAISTTNEAGVSLDTLILDAVDGKFATTDFATKSYVDELNGNRLTAETAILNAIKDSNNNLISSADILATATENAASISALTNVVNGHTNTIAGFVTKSEFNTAMASVTASALKNGSDVVSSADIIANVSNNASSISALSTRVGTVEGSINTLTTSIAGLATKTELANAEASLTSKVNTAQNGADAANNWINSNSSGLVTTANLDGAVATLFAENSNATSKDKVNALIQVKVEDGISNARIEADKIDLTGLTTFTNSIKGIIGLTTIDGSKITTGTISAERIDSDNLHVKAANIDGDIAAKSLSLMSLTPAGYGSKSYAVTLDGLTGEFKTVLQLGTIVEYDDVDNRELIYSPRAELIINASNFVMRRYNGGNDPIKFVEFKNDGSGSLAKGHISWDENGNVLFTDSVIINDLRTPSIRLLDLENPSLEDDVYTNIVCANRVVELTYTDSNGLIASADFAAGNGSFSGDLDVSGNFTHGSDSRRKDIKAYNMITTIESVAGAPAIKFVWEDRDDNTMHLGTTAQYWQNVLPETVKEYKDGTLGLEYDTVALLSVISAAKEIIALKQEVASLKAQLNTL